MKTLIAAIVMATLSLTAQARLGETAEQCDKRYGTPLAIQKAMWLSSGQQRGYVNENWIVHVEFPTNSVAALITFSHQDFKRTIAESQIEALLEANSQGKKWVKTPIRPDAIIVTHEWHREDGGFAYCDSDETQLFIASPEGVKSQADKLKADAEKMKAKEKKEIEGF